MPVSAFYANPTVSLQQHLYKSAITTNIIAIFYCIISVILSFLEGGNELQGLPEELGSSKLTVGR